MTTAYGYLLVESDESAERVMQSVMNHALTVLTRDITGITFLGDDSAHKKIPLSERTKGQELCRNLHRGDHLLIPSFDVFAHAVDALEMLGQWVATGVTVHSLEDRLTLDSASTVALLLKRLRGLDTFTRSFEQARRKALARKRNKAVNQHAEYGFQYVRGADGELHKVPHEDERDVLRWLLAYKRDWTWKELYAEALERGIKSREGQPPSLKCLRRMHAAAQRLAESGELNGHALSR